MKRIQRRHPNSYERSTPYSLFFSVAFLNFVNNSKTMTISVHSDSSSQFQFTLICHNIDVTRSCMIYFLEFIWFIIHAVRKINFHHVELILWGMWVIMTISWIWSRVYILHPRPHLLYTSSSTSSIKLSYASPSSYHRRIKYPSSSTNPSKNWISFISNYHHSIKTY